MIVFIHLFYKTVPNLTFLNEGHYVREPTELGHNEMEEEEVFLYPRRSFPIDFGRYFGV